MSWSRMVDLSQDFSVRSPAPPGYTAPQLRWINRLAWDGANGQELLTTMHVSTHLDSPAHFVSGGRFIGELPLDFLSGPACVVDLERMGIGDHQIYGPEHFEAWEGETGMSIQRDDILVIHTGYHKYYPENWTDRSASDETRYFLRHPGPDRAFAEWVLARGIRWLAVDTGSADHPMNTGIRDVRPDEIETAESILGKSLDEAFPRGDLLIMHTLLFPHGIVHIENLGGQIDEILDRRIRVGCFPWRFQGGESAMCRVVAFLE
jgi:kynurenine formamidase